MIKDKIKKLPKKPGVYIFKNQKGKIIYIGKALSLKNRVSSYFQNKHNDAKTLELIENITDLQIIEVSSEFEALLLEAKLIKQHKPKYNIQAKDGKSYLYIIISKEYPNRIYASRQPEKEESILSWYGPFPSSREVQEILKTIRRIFPFRSCVNLPKKTCLYYHLKLCPGACVNQDNRISRISEQSLEQENKNQDNREQSQEEYKKTIVQIKQMLSGKVGSLIKSLNIEMKSFAKTTDFEKASEIKYKIDSLQRLTQVWKNIPKDREYLAKGIEEIKNILIKSGGINLIALNKIEGYDVSNLGNQVIVGSMVAFVNAEPEKSQYRKFNLKYNLSFQDDPEGIKQIVRRRLNHPEWVLPQLILIDGGKTQIIAAFQALKEKKLTKQIPVLGLAKKEEKIIIPKIIDGEIKAWKTIKYQSSSLVHQLLQQIRDEAHRFAQRYYKKLYRKITFPSELNR